MKLDYINAIKEENGGYNFENLKRNEILKEKGVTFPTFRKTGTTICGIVCQNAVILGADTRATEGPIVADKNCSKLHYISKNIYCAGAGVAGDLEHTTLWLQHNVELHRLNTKTQPRVAMCVSRLTQELFKYQGYKVCAIVLGGVDVTGPQLYAISPHGSSCLLPFTALGSGSLNAMTVLEAKYRDNMTIEEGKELVAEAICAGIFNDLGSGGNVDICVITKDGTQHIRPYKQPNPRLYHLAHPTIYPKGTTPILYEKIENIKKYITIEDA
ncbi:proteasome subunit beta type-7, putative [Plasmodium vinckei vinckei]|uniref:Proteasome subunit beta n=1 Tax=Plasmodium vinckei vinckei TaxID=54757 RepID=A0A449BYS3_PLAVN|nr:proteasome subunit beta type-7, putative [Plasmodium vinckei vinckei]KEG04871.1 20S proteasome subunit beta 2 [Plasmodium vinckei vinckei]VEV58522.1 proteasome subunit beta type-7, putative [Plasmodium vinckei vinckei]